jgi:replication-associated recombination protein RarA
MNKDKPPKLMIYGAGGIGKTTFASVFPSKPKRKNKKSKGIPKLFTTRKR